MFKTLNFLVKNILSALKNIFFSLKRIVVVRKKSFWFLSLYMDLEILVLSGRNNLLFLLLDLENCELGGRLLYYILHIILYYIPMTVRLKGTVIVISSYGMARCQCPINNSTLETLIRTKMWKISSFSDSKTVWFWSFLHLCDSYKQECAGPFYTEPACMSINKQKQEYIIQNWSDKAFKGTVANWALLFCTEGYLILRLQTLSYDFK